MFEIYCVTARALCRENFLMRIGQIAQSRVDGLILREKDLPLEEYELLAAQTTVLCRTYGVRCILHNFPEAARRLGTEALHLPLSRLREMRPKERAAFSPLGASCHSVEEVEEAAKLGCTYVTLGHIYPTGCKPGVPPRGLELLREACRAALLPVYAIGGIGPENIASIREAGAAGACIMSGLMTCADPVETVKRLRKEAQGHAL